MGMSNCISLQYKYYVIKMLSMMLSTHFSIAIETTVIYINQLIVGLMEGNNKTSIKHFMYKKKSSVYSSLCISICLQIQVAFTVVLLITSCYGNGLFCCETKSSNRNVQKPLWCEMTMQNLLFHH